MEMVVAYFSIAWKMIIVFGLIVYGIPLGIWFFSYMSHVSSGNDFDDFEWDDSYYLSELDKFCDSIGATTGDDRAGASFLIIICLGLVWIIGIPICLYFMYVMHMKVKHIKYEESVRRAEQRRKQNYDNTL